MCLTHWKRNQIAILITFSGSKCAERPDHRQCAHNCWDAKFNYNAWENSLVAAMLSFILHSHSVFSREPYKISFICTFCHFNKWPTDLLWNEDKQHLTLRRNRKPNQEEKLNVVSVLVEKQLVEKIMMFILINSHGLAHLLQSHSNKLKSKISIQNLHTHNTVQWYLNAFFYFSSCNP